MQNPPGAYSGQPRVAFRPVARPGSEADTRSAASYAVDLLCLLIPLANFLSITLIGALPGGEVLTLLAVIPCVVVAWNRVWKGYNKTILILMGLWFLSQLVTDVYRHSPFGLMARGLAAIAFFAIDLVVISALAYKKPRRIVLLIMGQVGASAIFFYLFARSNYDSFSLAWKFGYAPFVNRGVILASCYFYAKKQYWVTFVLLIGLATVNLSQNFRSQMLIIMASSMLIIPLSSFARKSSPPWRVHPDLRAPSDLQSQKLPIKTLVLFVLVGLAGVGATKTYSYLAAQGSLGDLAQEKYVEQSRGKFGLLIGGRPETLISWRAVVDSPLLGHGSWAEDRKYSEMFADIIEETGYADDDLHQDTTSGNYSIPCHSFLMSAWVWAGILGALFWFYVLYLTGRTVLKLAVVQPSLSPYFSYLLLLEFWDVLFSPFGSYERIDQAVLLVILCSMLEGTSRSIANGPLRSFSGPRWMPANRLHVSRFRGSLKT